MALSPRRATILSLLFGLLMLLVVLGLYFGLHTTIELSPARGVVKTTKLLYVVVPVQTTQRPLWIADEHAQPSAHDWVLMHEYKQGAMGSKIDHTRWGRVVDLIDSWDELRLDPAARARLGERTRELITHGFDDRSLVIYLTRVNSSLLRDIADEQGPVSPDAIDHMFEQAVNTPIDS